MSTFDASSNDKAANDISGGLAYNVALSVTRLLVSQLIKANKKENINDLHGGIPLTKGQ